MLGTLGLDCPLQFLGSRPEGQDSNRQVLPQVQEQNVQLSIWKITILLFLLATPMVGNLAQLLGHPLTQGQWIVRQT